MDMKVTPNKDYIADLGSLALVSRLRRLLHRLLAEGDRVYRALELEFKPKWFPVVHLLSRHSPLTLTEIARKLSVSHPSMIETVEELISAGLIKSRKSKQDARARELFLTNKGEKLLSDLEPVWEAFRFAGDKVNQEDGNDFLKAVGALERALDKSSMYDRIMTRLEEHSQPHRKRS